MTAKISKAEAKAKGIVRFFTGEPCKHGHISERRVSSGECVECNLISGRKHKASPKWTESRLRLVVAQKAAGTYTKRLMERHRKCKYGVSEGEYMDMLAVQDNKCAVCGAVFDGSRRGTTPAVDHDHATGFVRGLLCVSCNTGIGKLKDSIQNLQSAVQYLNTTKKLEANCVS